MFDWLTRIVHTPLAALTLLDIIKFGGAIWLALVVGYFAYILFGTGPTKRN